IIQAVDSLRGKIEAKEALEMAERIKNSALQIDTVVRLLTDFVRVSTLELSAQDITALIDEGLLLLKNKLDMSKIEIVKEFQKNLPLILADRQKIEQVLVNLCMNAVQSMPAGGKLFFRAYETERIFPLSPEERRSGAPPTLKEKAVAVEVEDTGTGFSPDALSHIFEPFFSRQAPREARGMGLAIVKSILDMHNADIKIESQEGKGTKVTVFLRVAK
ncbi:MAG: ATP-binding protein, partial [Candidatus Omnitrophica bacterium]|nr:ATP-binding protein [Candidatus Omnitrophota bacterium]